MYLRLRIDIQFRTRIQYRSLQQEVDPRKISNYIGCKVNRKRKKMKEKKKEEKKKKKKKKKKKEKKKGW
ncbi:unnamed protein product [Schistosoma margrebowiei]|uniref:Uncharacterized protein n=1 Tax=Schistosoma margrebowiei TaxID=48269 RepID=A0A183MHF0_9TREM|nr:unnamed protein product [Schistosoma margrebowiei]